jgi:hypothetical protein
MPLLKHDGFNWLPLVTSSADLICKLEILMLREGQPGKVLYDIDNRVKTIFDALRKAKNPTELGAASSGGQQTPAEGEDPFYVLLEEDSLITHVAVTSDTLLQPVPNCLPETAVRLVVNVTVQTYKTHIFNVHFN